MQMKIKKVYLLLLAGGILLYLLFVAKNNFTSEYKKETKIAASKQTVDTLYLKGEKLFLKNCISCHSYTMTERSTAPALGGVTKRRDKKWLYRYIKNSIALYNQGDKLAIQLRNENGNLLMPAYPFLKNYQIDQILYFIEKRYDKTLRGVPIPYIFSFHKNDLYKAIVCKHILNEKAEILNSSRPDSLRWYFGCNKKHIQNDWVITNIKQLYELDSTINEISFLDYRFSLKAYRKNKNEEWKIIEKAN